MNQNDFQNEVIRALPPVGVSVTSIMGIPLQDWMYIATILYIIVQCACLIYRTWRTHRSKG